MTGDAVYLQHILDAIATIERYVAVGHDVFMTTSHWQDAVIRAARDHWRGHQAIEPGPAITVSESALAPNPWIARRVDPRLHGR
jgi:hypothetical protein